MKGATAFCVVALSAALASRAADFRSFTLFDQPMQGWFDEIRYTKRALQPSEFLVLQHKPFLGTTLIMR